MAFITSLVGRTSSREALRDSAAMIKQIRDQESVVLATGLTLLETPTILRSAEKVLPSSGTDTTARRPCRRPRSSCELARVVRTRIYSEITVRLSEPQATD